MIELLVGLAKVAGLIIGTIIFLAVITRIVAPILDWIWGL